MTRDFAGSPAVPPYPKDYLEDAMGALAGFFDYAVNDYGAERPLVADLFARSTLGRLFEQGAPWVVSGRSGVELFLDLSRELGFTDASAFPPPRWRSGRTAEYWAGWVAAYAQWRLGLTFRRLFEALPFDELTALAAQALSRTLHLFRSMPAVAPKPKKHGIVPRKIFGKIRGPHER